MKRGLELIRQCKLGNLLKVNQILESGNVDPNVKSPNGVTALMVACIHGHIKIIKRLFKCPKIDVNIQDTKGLTAFAHSWQIKNLEMVQLFLDNIDVDVNRSDNYGYTVLMTGGLYGNPKSLECLLNCPRIDIKRTNYIGNNAFMCACRGDLETVKIMKDKVNVNATNNMGKTALMLTCVVPNVDIVAMLLKIDYIKVNAQTPKKKESALHFACNRQNVQIVKLLLEHKDIDVNLLDVYSKPAFDRAFQWNTPSIEFIKLMVQRNDIDYTNTQYLEQPCKDSNIDAVKLLLSVKNMPVNWGESSNVLTACMKSEHLLNLDIIRMLLKRRDVDINVMYRTETLFFHACQFSRPDVAIMMLERDDLVVDIAVLHMCCKWGRAEVVNVLLGKKHFDLNVQKDGRTPLQIACDNGQVYTAKILLRHGAKPCLSSSDSAAIQKMYTIWPSYLPEWNLNNTCRYYPKEFNAIARTWLLVCTRLNVLSKDDRNLIIEYIARNWRRTEYKVVTMLVPV